MKRLLIISVFIVTAQSTVAGNFCCIKTSDVQLIREKMVSQIGRSHVVLFDIDGVLLTPKDPYNLGLLRQRTVDELMMESGPYAEKYSKKKREWLYSQFLLQHEERAVSSQMTELVHEVQKHSAAFGVDNPKGNVITMAITQAKAGQFGAIPSLVKWRSQQLAKLDNGGISFNTAFPAHDGIEFHKLSKNGDTPSMVDGILAACQACTKSTLFYEFMKIAMNIKSPMTVEGRQLIQQKIPAVHLVEDSEANLEEMSFFCNNVLGVPFYGYLFTGESEIRTSYDQEVAAEQMRRLLEENKWQSYEEVKASLASKRDEIVRNELQKIKEELIGILVFEQVP